MNELPRLQIPLALLTLGFFVMVAFQTVQLFREHGHIGDIRIAQEPTMQEGARLRRQLDGLASRTAQLADSGNANAKAIIDDLKRQGITVKPNP